MSSFDDKLLHPLRSLEIYNELMLGTAIRNERRGLGVKQHTLAEQVGVSRQWLIDVEHGKPRAEVGLVFLTLAALHMRVQLHVFPPPHIDFDLP